MNTETLLKRAKELEGDAHRHICDLATGKKRWNMSIPPQKDDSDILLSDAIQAGAVLREMVEKMREALEFYKDRRNMIFTSTGTVLCDSGNVAGQALSDADALAAKVGEI